MTKKSIWMLVIAWCCAVVVGVCATLDYELTPAPTENATRRWPDATRLTRSADSPTLVMFVHPRCPCSRASLAELAGLVSTHQSKFSTRVVFVRPDGFEDGWERTALFAAAERIPGVKVTVDDGKEAQHFGATTSGETLLYAADGRLLFQGGITPSRGHEGANTGREALAALIDTGHADTTHTAVYGCALAN